MNDYTKRQDMQRLQMLLKEALARSHKSQGVLKGSPMQRVKWDNDNLLLYDGNEYYYFPNAKKTLLKYQKPVFMLMHYFEDKQLGILMIRESPSVKGGPTSTLEYVYTTTDFYVQYLEAF